MLRRAGSLALLAATGLVSGVVVARLPPDVETAVVTRRHHGADPLLSAVLLRFGVSSLLSHPGRYFHPPFLYPDPNPLRGTEPLVAEALVAVPFRLALGDRPAVVYTSVKIATLALLALATGLLLQELGVRLSLCVLAAGLSLMVATTTVFVDRLQAVSLQWLPLTLLFALRYWRGGRGVYAAAFGVCLFLTVQASLYTTVMLLGTAPFLAPVLGPLARLEGARRRLPLLAAAAALAAAASLILLRDYVADRADVAAYSTTDYASEKSWNAFYPSDVLTSPPEYGPQAWRIGPASSWDGLYPGTAFVLFVAVAAGLAAFELARAGVPLRRRGSRALLGGLLVVFTAALALAATAGAGVVTQTLAAAALWGALLTWCARLLFWPVPGDEAERLRLFGSSVALAAFVLLVLSLGSPIRLRYFSEPLATGLFGPLSSVLSPLREMRELKRYLLPAGWAIVVTTAIALELRLRALPRAVGPALAAALLAIGLAERADADTRKASLPPLPDGYELLRGSARSGGLLELPFDEWGRIASIHRMLWQPRHGRPVVAGRTGLDPAWYSPAHAVFNSFPSDESLLLLRAWGVDSVLDTRGEWRLVDLPPRGDAETALAEPAVPEGAWESPAVANGGAASDAARATDGSTETAQEVGDPEGVAFALPPGKAASAVEIDYGAGRFGRVPAELRVLGRSGAGEWLDLADPQSARLLRARAANQLLRRRTARLVVLLRPGAATELRLVSAQLPWDLPELRVRLAASGPVALSEAR